MRSFAEHETKERGSFDFPAAYYHVDYFHPRYEMPFHWHMECEFVLMLRGKLTLLLDGDEMALLPGNIAFIPGGVIHGGFPAGKDSAYACIVLDLEEFLRETAVGQTRFLLNLYGGIAAKGRLIHQSAAGRAIEWLFAELGSRREGYKFVAIGLLWEFAGALIREEAWIAPASENGQSAQRVQQIRRALNRIRQDYKTPLTLQELSGEAHMSPKYFCRFFRNMTGRTPIDYLNYYRTERAAEMIYATDHNITDIAFYCGFNDLGYFGRSFRKYKGLSPSEYRKHLQTFNKTSGSGLVTADDGPDAGRAPCRRAKQG